MSEIRSPVYYKPDFRSKFSDETVRGIVGPQAMFLINILQLLREFDSLYIRCSAMPEEQRESIFIRDGFSLLIDWPLSPEDKEEFIQTFYSQAQKKEDFMRSDRSDSQKRRVLRRWLRKQLSGFSMPDEVYIVLARQRLKQLQNPHFMWDPKKIPGYRQVTEVNQEVIDFREEWKLSQHKALKVAKIFNSWFDECEQQIWERKTTPAIKKELLKISRGFDQLQGSLEILSGNSFLRMRFWEKYNDIEYFRRDLQIFQYLANTFSSAARELVKEWESLSPKKGSLTGRSSDKPINSLVLRLFCFADKNARITVKGRRGDLMAFVEDALDIAEMEYTSGNIQSLVTEYLKKKPQK